jgi:hypothetical protein
MSRAAEQRRTTRKEREDMNTFILAYVKGGRDFYKIPYHLDLKVVHVLVCTDDVATTPPRPEGRKGGKKENQKRKET